MKNAQTLTRLQRNLPPLAVASLVLLATLFASWTAYSVYRSRDRERFARQVAEIADGIEARLDAYLVLLHAARALLADGGQPERLGEFVETLDLNGRFVGLRGLGFVGRVRNDDLAAVEERMRQAEHLEFAVEARPEEGEIFPILVLEPHDERSHAALGFDMSSDPVRWAAMERARDSGMPAASGKVQLGQERDGPDASGFVVFMPVYSSGPTTRAEERCAALRGFIFGTVDPTEFVTAVVAADQTPQLTFGVYDGDEALPEHLLYREPELAEDADDEPTFTAKRKISMAGQDWTLAFQTTPAFDAASRLNIIPYLLIGGTLISGLLFITMRAQADARHAAERNASVLQSLLTARRESEARRAAILESSLDAIVAMDEAGRITEFNRAAEQMFGFQRGDVLGRDLFETMMPEEERGALRDAFTRYLATGEGGFLGRRMEATARRSDGSTFSAELTVSEIRLDSGREFTAHVRDITERKEYEARLRLERETVETLQRVTSSFAAKLDLQPLIQDVIDAATAGAGADVGVFFYSGPSEDGREGERLWAVSGVPRSVFEGCPPPRPTALLGATLTGRQVVRLADVAEDPRFGKNAPHFGLPIGHPPVRSYLAAPVITGSGAMLGSILLGHSRPGRFTERHESFVLAVAAQAAVSLDKAWLYRTAQEARRAAELANRAKDEFLATLSHELRTPLTAILGWCQLLKRGHRSEAEMARGLERIESSAQAQTRLISDLLDVSRIVSGKLRLEVQPLDLEPVIEAAIEAIRPAVEAKSIEIRSRSESTPAMVAGDASRLQQVFWNLLSNAVKFTPKGGRIEVGVEYTDGHAVVRVRDNGCGIRPEDLACIFDRFRQVDSSTTRRSGGLGLGLAIVRHLVELHGGTVRAESEGENRGATFFVSLPVLSAPAPALAMLRPSARHAQSGSGHRAPALLDGVRVLVVEDDAETRELLRVILEEVGAEVIAVPSVSRAIEALREHPDVLVSDIAMPEHDGYDLIRYVRGLRSDEGGRIPALALTAFARNEDSRRALLAGFQMHAAKPVEPEDLVSMVAALVRRPVMARSQST